jgi:hypothetical protein
MEGHTTCLYNEKEKTHLNPHPLEKQLRLLTKLTQGNVYVLGIFDCCRVHADLKARDATLQTSESSDEELESSHAFLFACPPGGKTSEKSNLLEKLRKFLVKHTVNNEILLPGILTKLKGKNGVEATISNPQDFILKWATKTDAAHSDKRKNPTPAAKVGAQVEEE